jgi:hypothetical protein
MGILRNASIEEDDLSACTRGVSRIVRHHYDCDALVIQGGKKIEYFSTTFGVEIAGRLISQDYGRFVDESPRDRNSLALSAGELVRLMVESVSEPYSGEGLSGTLSYLGVGAASLAGPIDERHGDIP